jgi:hypothetical protein
MHNGPESCGNDGAGGNCGKPTTGFPRVSTAPWKSRQRRAGFPHSHSSDDGLLVEREEQNAAAKQEQVRQQETKKGGSFSSMASGSCLLETTSHFQDHSWIGICCCGTRIAAPAASRSITRNNGFSSTYKSRFGTRYSRYSPDRSTRADLRVARNPAWGWCSLLVTSSGPATSSGSGRRAPVRPTETNLITRHRRAAGL